jgi:hypothetical protein
MLRSICAIILLILLATVAGAGWAEDPLLNVPLSTAGGEKYDIFAVSDGVGGMIVAWEDERDGDSDIYAQRIDVNGDVLWQTDGVQVCTAADDQSLYNSATSTTGFTPLLADGAGGVWIAWQDSRLFPVRGRDIYIQRLDADGGPLLGHDGLLVAGGAAFEQMPSMCADGAGGIFIAWEDKNDDPIFNNLYGQHFNGGGEPFWNGGSPLPLVVQDWDQDAPSLCPDGAGGFYMAWEDSRDNLNDIYTQRFDQHGSPLWTAGGIAVAVNANGADAIVAIRGDDNSVLLSWVDRRGSDPDIYAQKFSPEGLPLWTNGGQLVCNATNSQYRPSICVDGAGGAIIAWFDMRVATGYPWDLNIYAQRIDAAGTALWTINGAPVCQAPDAQRDATLCADGQGGAFIAWEDNRTGTGNEDVYIQWLDGDGTPGLIPDGQAMSLAANNQARPVPLAGPGSVLAVWPDDRDLIYNNDIYGDRILLADGGVPAVNRLLFDFSGETGPSSRDFSVSNVGATTLTITAVELAAGDAGFELEFEIAPPFAMAPGEQRQVTVNYDPAGGEGLTDVVLIHHDVAQFQSPLMVQLSRGDLPTGASESPAAGIRLSTYPNPFNPRTVIGFSLDHSGPVQLVIYNLQGKLVRVLASREFTAGSHELIWDGRDRVGRDLPSGTYLLRTEIAGNIATCKLTMLH